MTKPTIKRKSTYLLDVLTFALNRMRPHGGVGVEELAQFIERQFPGRIVRDKVGNLHLDLRGQPRSTTLFVAHLDTVHHRDGRNFSDWTRRGWVHAKGDVLGADDAAGVAILCYLAKRGVPGYYVFTQGEERGGIGSKYIADYQHELLGQFDRAIAFDRRDLISVVSHQGWGGRCCSDEFAEALSTSLNDAGLLYLPDDTGVYTDTAEFVYDIPECTNISVGYYDEHSQRECLDLDHFIALANAALTIDWEALPTKRDPSELYDATVFDLGGAEGMAVIEGKYETVEYTDFDYDLIDALENAREGSNGSLAMILAERMMDDPDSVEIAERSIARMRIDTRYIDEAFDLIDEQGGEIAADILIEQLIG